MENLEIFVSLLLVVIELCRGQGVSRDLYLCRQMCYTKFIQDWHHCMDYDECKNMCITPPNINNYIPEAFSFLCWNSCDETLGPFPLTVTSTSREGSLILTNIAWDQSIANKSKQCLVTWEISGGGLMGNLLTDSPTVELSLWADTIYHIQVTCRNKKSNAMRRSYKLIVDTKTINIASTATDLSSSSSSSVTPSSPIIPVISLDTNLKRLQDYFPSETFSRDDPVNHLRVLKDSTREDRTINNRIDTSDITTTTTKTTTTTTKTAADSNIVETTDDEQITMNHNLPSVIRSKLTKYENNNPSAIDEYIKDILYIAIGLTGIFLGFLVIYISTRSSRNDLSTDKEQLIRDENNYSSSSSSSSSNSSSSNSNFRNNGLPLNFNNNNNNNNNSQILHV